MKTELLKKIKTLADNGIGGEKENAQKILDELMLKYNIKEEDIEEETIKEFDIKTPHFYCGDRLAVQVFYSIVGHIDERKGFYSYKWQGKKKRYLKCTSAEFLEYEAKLEFYSYYFKKELKMFYSAFIEANKIFPPREKCNDNNDDYELTEEDYKMLELSRKLEKHDYLLQIEGGTNDTTGSN